jgi:5-formyltetrahydrofolate cyclo-ligase
MAVPRLRERRPFILLAPERLRLPPRKAASIKGAASTGRPVRLEDMDPVDMVVCGSVAVDRRGARVGKGGGYSDLEFGLLVGAGLVGDDTTIVTTVHTLQVLDERLPETAHDFRVDRIVTPDEVIRCRRSRRPQGILWDHLDQRKIEAVPALRSMQPSV